MIQVEFDHVVRYGVRRLVLELRLQEVLHLDVRICYTICDPHIIVEDLHCEDANLVGRQNYIKLVELSRGELSY